MKLTSSILLTFLSALCACSCGAEEITLELPSEAELPGCFWHHPKGSGTKSEDLKRGKVRVCTDVDFGFSADSKITDAQVARLAGLVPLTTLYISDVVYVTKAGTQPLATLVNLQALRLCGYLHDEDLEFMQGLKRLRRLEVFGTFTNRGLAALSELKQLEFLDIGGSAGKGCLSSLAGLTALTELVLWELGSLSDANLEVLPHLPQLKCLHLPDGFRFGKRSKLTDTTLGFVGKVRNLEELDLGAGCFSDEGIAQIAGLGKLRRLSMAGCRELTAACFVHLQHLNALEALTLADSWHRRARTKGAEGNADPYSQDDLKHLVSLKELKQLEMYFLIDDVGLSHICQLPKLATVRLSPLVSDKGLDYLSKMSALETVTAVGNEKITDEGLAKLPGLKNLKNLDLSGAKKITDEGIAYIGALQSLRNLRLVSCGQLTGKALEQLALAPNLDALDVSWCYSLDDAGMKHLAQSRSLRSLKLSFCGGLGRVGILELEKLTTLKQITMDAGQDDARAGMAELLKRRPDVNAEKEPVK